MEQKLQLNLLSITPFKYTPHFLNFFFFFFTYSCLIEYFTLLEVWVSRVQVIKTM